MISLIDIYKSKNGENLEQQRIILMKNLSLRIVFGIIFREFLMHLNFKVSSPD